MFPYIDHNSFLAIKRQEVVWDLVNVHGKHDTISLLIGQTIESPNNLAF